MPKGGCNSVETIAEAMRVQPGNCSYPANGTGLSCLPEATPVTSCEDFNLRLSCCQEPIEPSEEKLCDLLIKKRTESGELTLVVQSQAVLIRVGN